MHGSIPTVTIPWAHPRGFAIFSSLGILFPTPRTKKEAIPHPQDTLKQTALFHKKMDYSYYVLQNRSTWTCMQTKVRKHLSRCFCFLSVFLWLLTPLSCIFFKHMLYKLGQIVFLQPIAYKLEDFPAKKSANCCMLVGVV